MPVGWPGLEEQLDAQHRVGGIVAGAVGDVDAPPAGGGQVDAPPYLARRRRSRRVAGAAWTAAAVTLVERTMRTSASASTPGSVSAFRSWRTSTCKLSRSKAATASADSPSAIKILHGFGPLRHPGIAKGKVANGGRAA